MERLKRERAQLVAEREEVEAIPVSAVAAYMASHEFEMERSRIAEEARYEMMETEVDALVEDKREATYCLGFGKGLRAARRFPERDDLGVEDAFDDEAAANVEG